MLLARLIATALFLQGVSPILLFGAWRPGGWFLVCVACIYTLLSRGLWEGRRWALPLALVLTSAQLLIVSSALFSWQFYVGASAGFGIAPAATFYEMPLFIYHSFGSELHLTFGHNGGLVAQFAASKHESFVIINVLVVPLFLLLLILLGAKFNSPSVPLPSDRDPVQSDAREGAPSVSTG